MHFHAVHEMDLNLKSKEMNKYFHATVPSVSLFYWNVEFIPLLCFFEVFFCRLGGREKIILLLCGAISKLVPRPGISCRTNLFSKPEKKRSIGHY